MNGGKHNSESAPVDPEKLAQLLEIELMQKRAAWQQTKTRRGNLRAISFFFLFLVIAGALFGFFFFLNPERVQELRASSSETATPTPTPGAP